VFDIEAIKQRLPHRFPFLLVDRIAESSETKAVGIKNVSVNEPFFQGHFPGESIMPGALIAEAMAQTCAFIGGPGGAPDPDAPPKRVFLSSLQTQFKRPVVPGDALRMEVEVIKQLGALVRCRGIAKVDGEPVAVGEFTLAEAP
jgi:3-hydroxyacyl-[acyl-carrier-protein] dehydratase